MDANDLFTLSALFHNATAIALWLFWLLVIVLIATRKKWRIWVRLSLIGVIIAQQIVFVMIPMYRHYQAKAAAAEKEKRGIAEYQAWKAKAQAMFDERCKKAGYFVYKKVPKQDSVYIMTPSFEKPTKAQIEDQYWKGDPYTYQKYDKGEYFSGFGSYLYPWLRCTESVSHDALGKQVFTPTYQWYEPPFKFIEIPDKERPEQIMRYTAAATEETQGTGGRSCDKRYPKYKNEGVPIQAMDSVYGSRTEDISTKEERNNWIAGSRLQIIELHTGEVVAERIGYLWNRAPKQTMHSSRGWDFTVDCPPPNIFRPDHTFIEHVLSKPNELLAKHIVTSFSSGKNK